MVLSNKKLKHKLRSKFEQISVSKDEDSEKQTKSEIPKTLKQLLDSTTTQKPGLSKREKRREIPSSSQINGESNVDKTKKKRKREKTTGGENGGKLVAEVQETDEEMEKMERKRMKREKRKSRSKDEDGVRIRVKEDDDSNKKVKTPMMSKKLKKKKKKTNKKKGTIKEEEKQIGVENGGAFSHQIIDETCQGNDNDDCMKVYVGGMPYSSTEDDIWSYFDHCGAITDIDCMKFPESGTFRGIAIISFKTEEAAKKALALDGSDMDGLYLKIQPYKTTRNTKSSNFSPPVIEGYNRIYAGNLSWDITDDDLRQFFSDCNISSIRFGEDKETGEFKGYAHVDFADNASLAKALKLDQKVVCGRPVKISRAVPMKVPLRNPVTTPTLPAVKTEENTSGVGSGKLRRRTCYECGEKGHLSSACPNKQATEQTNSSAS